MTDSSPWLVVVGMASEASYKAHRHIHRPLRLPPSP